MSFYRYKITSEWLLKDVNRNRNAKIKSLSKLQKNIMQYFFFNCFELLSNADLWIVWLLKRLFYRLLFWCLCKTKWMVRGENSSNSAQVSSINLSGNTEKIQFLYLSLSSHLWTEQYFRSLFVSMKIWYIYRSFKKKDT
jgi:hypothetical protein